MAAVVPESTSARALEGRARSTDRPFSIGIAPAILGIAALIVALDNRAFWSAVLKATAADEHRIGILLSLGSVLAGTLVILLTLAVGRWTLKIVGAVLLVSAAVCAYFMTEYGIVIDDSMIRNIFETETREAAPLLGSAFVMHVALVGVAPALLLLAAPLRSISLPRELSLRVGVVVATAVIAVGIVYANYGAVSFFVRDHHPLRLLANPIYPINSLARYLAREDDRPPPVREQVPASVPAAYAARRKPTLVVFVAGETARSDRFSYNGYARDTNRYTRPFGVVNFAHVTSCGTSTSDSVPCMLSGLGKAHFTHAAAAERESLLGTLERLGTAVNWRDNSTGCKDVCSPAQFEELAARTDADVCDATGCFDEILLKGLDRLVADTTRNHFIVMHQRGSHGPAYHSDTPRSAKIFLPECDLPNLRNCSIESINNAYDNTILYSDYFIARVIDFLAARSGEYDVAMLYVSDHGESLGEHGLYLHGLPYKIAPPEQTRVPMLFWASPGFYASNGIEPACASDHADRELSHDWIYHTLLPLLGIDTPSYRADLDVFAVCRGDARS
jgi:lipid A ethanolaminephosphotransferase